MGKIYDHISNELAEWMGRQHLFFVATAPLSARGHVNCSPKGGDSFRVLDPRTVAYQDLTGSGVETIAHLRENGRIVLMFCAFEGSPTIVRLHGKGEVLTGDHPDFRMCLSGFPENPGTRAIVRVHISRISDSCGYGVPRFEFREDRNTLDAWAMTKGPEKLEQYRREKNRKSIDGLEGLGTPDI